MLFCVKHMLQGRRAELERAKKLAPKRRKVEHSDNAEIDWGDRCRAASFMAHLRHPKVAAEHRTNTIFSLPESYMKSRIVDLDKHMKLPWIEKPVAMPVEPPAPQAGFEPDGAATIL